MVQALEMAADDTMGNAPGTNARHRPLGPSCTAMPPELPARAAPTPRRGGTGSTAGLGHCATPAHTTTAIGMLGAHGRPDIAHHHAQPAHHTPIQRARALTLPCGTVLWLPPGRAPCGGPRPAACSWPMCTLARPPVFAMRAARAHGHHGRQHRPAGCCSPPPAQRLVFWATFACTRRAQTRPWQQLRAWRARHARKWPWTWCWATTTATGTRPLT